jgi:uncharacterized protein (TIGR00369 family)
MKDLTEKKMPDVRVRTVAWASPAFSVWTGRPKNAVDHLHGIRAGEIPKPPLYELLCIDVLDARSGYAALTLKPDASFTSPMGIVGGGIISTVLDTTLAWACDTLVPDNEVSVTIELKTNFLRPVSTSAPTLVCEADCVFCGSRTMVAQAKLRDDVGRIYAIATATLMRVEREKPV